MNIKLYKSIIFYILSFLVFGGNLFAQIHLNEKPVSKLYNLNGIPSLEISRENNEKTNEFSKNTLPLRAGITLKIDEKLISEGGKWERVDDNLFVWRISFYIKDAKAINVYFKDFELDDNDRLFIYSSGTKHYLGAFSKLNNAKYFATGLINNDTVVIEFSSEKIKPLPFKINELGLILHNDKSFGDAGSCEVPVNCEEGKNWHKQKSGVTRILVKDGSGLYWCTGSLINNTAKDGKPYILTANHCGRFSTVENYKQWVFDFNFESPDCSRPQIEPESITYTGASMIAHGETPGKVTASDFKLLLLNDTIPGSNHLYFNGWDRTGNTPDNGVVIHHPQGDIKFISTYKDAVSSFYYGIENPNAPFWKVIWMETNNGYGVTEGGSSGSPLFDQNGLIIGTLTGGDASCEDNNYPDYFGKFSSHWDQNGNLPEEQLKPWLDPLNTGAATLKGFYKNQEALIADFYSDVKKVTPGSYVNFYNKSKGSIKKYTWLFEGGQPDVSHEKTPPPVLYKTTGKFNVKLIVESEYEADSLIEEKYIDVIGNLFPNPFIKSVNEKVRILVGDTPEENISVNIYNIAGKQINTVNCIYGNNEIIFNPQSLSAGVYIIYVVINNTETPYKLVVLNQLKN